MLNLKPKKTRQRIAGLYGVWEALRGPAFKVLYSSLTISAAAAKKMKEAEVAIGGGGRGAAGSREENRKGVGRGPLSLGRDNSAVCPVLGLSCCPPKLVLTHRSGQAGEDCEEKGSKHPLKKWVCY